MFLEMNVNRMRPIASAFEFPNLRGITFHFEANIIAIKECAVDNPLTVVSIEFEATVDPFCHSGRYLIERGIGGRVYTIVCHSVRNHTKLQHLSPLTGRKNIIRWSGAIALLKTIL